MKHRALAVFLLVWFTAGCGKVGDPRPPSIRIPVRVVDLKVIQDQYQAVLSWTNPSKYVDGSRATDLSNVRILKNGNPTPVATIKISEAGKPQTASVSIDDALGTTVTFSVVLETSRGKTSEMSNGISVSVVDVPGMVVNLIGHRDQGMNRLEWAVPSLRASMADVYMVRRGDGVMSTVTTTFFEDSAIEADKTYSYIVTAAHGSASPVPGPSSAVVFVEPHDGVPPKTPTGLMPPRISETGAILQWDQNTEADLAGYRIYRSSSSTTGFAKVDEMVHKTNSFLDDGYRPGMYYKISAVDMDGNESPLSPAVSAP